MTNDAPIHECESEIDHYTGHYVPYSLRRVCGFFNVPQIYYMCKGLWDGAYGLSSLSQKTRKSNRLQMSLQRQHFLLRYLKTLSVGPAWVWTYGLPLGMRSPNWGSIKMSNKPRSETSLFDSYCNNSVDTRSMHKYRFFICLYVSLFRTPSRLLANIRIWNDVPIPIRLSSSWWLWFEHWRMGIRRFGTIPQVPSSSQY